MAASDPLRIVSWNVNGIRAAARKGLAGWLASCDADIVGLQEVRARPEQVPDELGGLDGWHAAWHAAERPGYSGVLLLSRRAPDRVRRELGEERLDREGRFVLARFGRLVVANVYFPNGSGRDRDNSRVPYKLDFYGAVHEELDRWRRSGHRVLVMGDFNTAHREIDLARPAANRRTSGFLDVERAELDRWMASGWTDAFRHVEPGGGHYTWWSQRQGVRERNVGWRIDYVLVTPPVLGHLETAWHEPTVAGSDHCPVGVALDPAVLGR